MDGEFAEKAWSVIVFVFTFGAMVAAAFGVFKLVDWARETRRMAEEALAAEENSDSSGPKTDEDGHAQG